MGSGDEPVYGFDLDRATAARHRFGEHEGRRQALEAILRYGVYPCMLYRTNLWLHTLHLEALLQSVIPTAQRVWGELFDAERALALAAVHDDPEIVMGDVMFGDKLLFTQEQRAALARQEEAARQAVCERFPSHLGLYRYTDLLEEEARCNTWEAQLVKYVDKYAALGEALHELFAGNGVFATVRQTSYGSMQTPFFNYRNWFSTYLTSLPLLAPLAESGHPLFGAVTELDEQATVARGRLHTHESMQQPTGYAPYDAWRTALMMYGGETVMKALQCPRER